MNVSRGAGSSIRRMVARMPAPRYWGRDGELRVLGGALDDAALGKLTGVIIEGEAGIGKSRLLSEGLVTARDRGFQIVIGRAEKPLVVGTPCWQTAPKVPKPRTDTP